MRLNKTLCTIDAGWFVQASLTWTRQTLAQVNGLWYARSEVGVQDTSVVTVQRMPLIMERLRAVHRPLNGLHFGDATADGLTHELNA